MHVSGCGCHEAYLVKNNAVVIIRGYILVSWFIGENISNRFASSWQNHEGEDEDVAQWQGYEGRAFTYTFYTRMTQIRNKK